MGSTKPNCLICNETVALVKSGNVKRNYETKHAHFEQNYPQNSEVRARKINHPESSYQATCSVIVSHTTRACTHQPHNSHTTRACIPQHTVVSLPFQPWIWWKTNTGAHSLMKTYISASAWPSHLLCLNLKHTKGVTFHTNKARPHHLLCIVWTFLLELCFWI